MLVQAFRAFRVIQLVRMFEVCLDVVGQNPHILTFGLVTYQAVRLILETIISVLPEVANILLLLLLVRSMVLQYIAESEECCGQVYSMFATLFVQIFGITKYGKRISDTANFESFPSALLTIYQMVVGVRSHFQYSQDSSTLTCTFSAAATLSSSL